MGVEIWYFSSLLYNQTSKDDQQYYSRNSDSQPPTINTKGISDKEQTWDVNQNV